MIFMSEGQTLQCEASAATSLCVTVYARTTNTIRLDQRLPMTPQRVGFFALTGAATVDTVVAALGAGIFYEVININIANSNSAARTVRVWHVDEGDTAGTDNFIAYDATVPANGSLTIGEMGISA